STRWTGCEVCSCATGPTSPHTEGHRDFATVAWALGWIQREAKAFVYPAGDGVVRRHPQCDGARAADASPINRLGDQRARQAPALATTVRAADPAAIVAHDLRQSAGLVGDVDLVPEFAKAHHQGVVVASLSGRAGRVDGGMFPADIRLR